MFLLIIIMKMRLQKSFLISIHLMFLLIVKGVLKNVPLAHFNTSHVSINQRTETKRLCSSSNFNTSHVSINQILSML